MTIQTQSNQDQTGQQSLKLMCRFQWLLPWTKQITMPWTSRCGNKLVASSWSKAILTTGWFVIRELEVWSTGRMEASAVRSSTAWLPCVTRPCLLRNLLESTALDRCCILLANREAFTTTLTVTPEKIGPLMILVERTSQTTWKMWLIHMVIFIFVNWTVSVNWIKCPARKYAVHKVQAGHRSQKNTPA